jgi:hypothetical protein
MRQQSVLLGLAATLPSTLAWAEPNDANPLSPRQTGDSNTDDVASLCKPEPDGDGPVAPCISIESIEVQCAPNGTEPLNLDAHAQCMCKGSFFAEKLACERCLNVHGLLSERDYLHYQNVLSVVSSELCGSATPTAVFASIYSWVQETQPRPTTGATGTSDSADGATEVSYYYTASGPQGPGRIEGAAASATAESSEAPETTTVTSTAATTTSTGGADEAEETGDDAEEASSTTGENGAVPTAAAGGIAWGIAGAAILAAL